MKESAWGLDISWLVNLFYHASKGNDEPNSTIRSFTFNLVKILKKQKPTFLVAAVDSHLSFRKELDPTYKSSRTEKDDEYVEALIQIKELLDVLGIPQICVDKYEADDVLATLAEEFKKLSIPFVAVISDKDYNQNLVFRKVGAFNKPKKQDWRFWGQLDAEKKWGIKIEQCVSYQSLVGDKIDDVRGCDSIGPKRASELLTKYNTIEGIYENIKELSASTQKNLENFQPRLETVRKLVTLVRDCGNFGNVLENYQVETFRVDRPALRKVLARNDILNLEKLLLETLNSD